MSLLLKLRAYRRLGLGNLTQVALYRVGLKLGVHPVLKIQADLDGQEFYRFPAQDENLPPAPGFWKEQSRLFAAHSFDLNDNPPAWHQNPFTGVEAGGMDQPWHQLSDFRLPMGDIKTVWEASRFDWVLAMAQRAARGDSAEMQRLNDWLVDWSEKNPAYCGVNWKCGQEASIRVMHLALAARFMNQEQQPQADLVKLLEAHLHRIEPTLAYAMAQDNNHGTSEAGALFVGGLLCLQGAKNSGEENQARLWIKAGRRWLENRARRLIAKDGSFSQHSLNYHRVMLDTYSQAELWRQWMGQEPFTETMNRRVAAAAQWLRHMIDKETGDGPNLGGNDGADLLPLTEAGYRDFRPAVQLASALFAQERAYVRPGRYDEHLAWLKVQIPAQTQPELSSQYFEDGGYGLLISGPMKALLNIPCYRFRPRHCDALHLDLWYKSRNLLGDAGSYSYNCEAPWQKYFSGTAAHNAIMFDGQEQMPSVSRFLRGDWLRAHDVHFDADAGEMAVTIRSNGACEHRRRVLLDDGGLEVHDSLHGTFSAAVLRWHLEPGNWQLQTGENGKVEVTKAGVRILVEGTVPPVRLELVDGWDSKHYLQKTEHRVLEIEVTEPCQLTTRLLLTPPK